jgi:hypothetical protein
MSDIAVLGAIPRTSGNISDSKRGIEVNSRNFIAQKACSSSTGPDDLVMFFSRPVSVFQRNYSRYIITHKQDLSVSAFS